MDVFSVNRILLPPRLPRSRRLRIRFHLLRDVSTICWSRLRCVLLCATLSGLVCGCDVHDPHTADQAPTGTQAAQALARRDYSAAIEIAEVAWQQSTDDVALLLVGAEAATKAGDINRALLFLERLPEQPARSEVYAGWQRKAQLLQQKGDFTASCRTLQHILVSHPDDVIARQRLSRLLGGCGLWKEAREQLRKLLENGSAAAVDLIQLARNGDALFSRDELNRAWQSHPHDVMSLCGLLEHAGRNRDTIEFQRLLDRAEIAERPPFIQWHWLSLQLVTVTKSAAGTNAEPTATSSTGRQSIEQTLQKLLKQNSKDSETWRLTAECFQHQPDAALHCLGEAFQCDPWNISIVHALADSAAGQRPVAAKRFRQLAARLRNIEQTAMQLNRQGETSSGAVSLMEQLTNELISLGRVAEARSWATLAIRHTPRPSWAVDLVRQSTSGDVRVPNDAKSSFGLWTDSVEGVLHLTRSCPSPKWDVATDTTSAPASDHHRLRFADVAEARGMTFQFDNGVLPGQEGLQMHQWTGGGAGVLDLDGDHWPDLFLSQGGPLLDSDFVSRAASEQHAGDSEAIEAEERFVVVKHALFRNRRGVSFEEVAVEAMIPATAYGQGVAIGDVNNDGFDDVYVACVGRNRLLVNQGDGTFLSADAAGPSRSDEAIDANAWTTSVAVADVNSDTNPDLFDVNYVSGQFTQTCSHDGRQRVCGPLDFPAAADVAWLSTGDGRFVGRTAEPEPIQGRGMGLVVGGLKGPDPAEGTLVNQIFVANDETANVMLSYHPESAEFIDIAVSAGTAFDGHGSPTGSMGIAAGDVDGNGLPDLFVTNYFSEANTLYRQPTAGLWLDGTAAAGLSVPGFAMLGFGCQLVDFDGDCDQDLIVANGHLDDFRFRGHPYHMRTQLLENDGQGRFREVFDAGDYFRREYLGRAVAVLDWDRDGLCDAVVTHLDVPVALLSNQSQALHLSRNVRLIGTKSSRDSIGAVVNCRSMASSSAVSDEVAFLLAGDGYQCSNERCARFALTLPSDDPQPAASRIQVLWPTGTNSTSSIPSTYGEVIVIEGRSTVYNCPQ